MHSNGRSGDHDLVADLFVLFILDLVLTTKKAHSNGRLGDHDFVVLGNWKCRQLCALCVASWLCISVECSIMSAFLCWVVHCGYLHMPGHFCPFRCDKKKIWQKELTDKPAKRSSQLKTGFDVQMLTAFRFWVIPRRERYMTNMARRVWRPLQMVVVPHPWMGLPTNVSILATLKMSLLSSLAAASLSRIWGELSQWGSRQKALALSVGLVGMRTNSDHTMIQPARVQIRLGSHRLWKPNCYAHLKSCMQVQHARWKYPEMLWSRTGKHISRWIFS